MNLRKARRVVDRISGGRALYVFDVYAELRKKPRFSKSERMRLRALYELFLELAYAYDAVAFHEGRPSTGLKLSLWDVTRVRCEADRVIATGCRRIGCHEDTGVQVRSLMCFPNVVCGGCAPLCKRHRGASKHNKKGSK